MLNLYENSNIKGLHMTNRFFYDAVSVSGSKPLTAQIYRDYQKIASCGIGSIITDMNLPAHFQNIPILTQSPSELAEYCQRFAEFIHEYGTNIIVQIKEISLLPAIKAASFDGIQMLLPPEHSFSKQYKEFLSSCRKLREYMGWNYALFIRINLSSDMFPLSFFEKKEVQDFFHDLDADLIELNCLDSFIPDVFWSACAQILTTCCNSQILLTCERFSRSSIKLAVSNGIHYFGLGKILRTQPGYYHTFHN